VPVLNKTTKKYK